MKTTIKYLSLILVYTYIVFQLTSCKEKSPTEPVTQNPRSASWEKDIDYFSSQLKAKQYGFSSLISEESFDNILGNLKSSIESLQDYEIYLRLQQSIASLKVAHLICYPSSTRKLHFLPFFTYIFPDGVYIIMADQNNSGLLGKKIISIGGITIQTVEDSLKKIISYENDYWFEDQVPQALCCVEILKYYGFTGTLSSVDLEVEGVGKLTVTSAEKYPNDITSGMNNVLDGKTVPLYLQNQSSYYWSSFIAANITLYIKYNKCANSTTSSFDVFTNGIINFISSHQVDKVIVDLRNNGGGNSSIINPLLNYLQGSSINQRGKLFVVTNRGTFSSALLNSISFKQTTNCILVGEPTGGKPNSYGEVFTFSLPYSGIVVQYCTKYINTINNDPASLFPDYDVEISFNDFVNCKDPVLDFILNFK